MQLQDFINKSSGILQLPGNEYMIDRLVGKLSQLHNIVLVAHKGWGISTLIREAGFRITEKNEDIRVFYFDMGSIFDKSTFIRVFTQELCRSLSVNIHELEVQAGEKVSQPGYENLKLADSIASKKRIKLITFISNFDHINRFIVNHQEFRLLRLILVNQKNCAFCISGSNQPFFESLFGKVSNPMSPFGRIYYLKRKVNQDYSSYVKHLFFQSGKQIEHNAVKHITHLTENHLFYIKLLSWYSYLRTEFTCSTEIVDCAFRGMQAEFQLHLRSLLAGITTKQFFYLGALANGFNKICSREVLEKYKLGRSSNVARIKKNLLAKELIEIQREQVIIIDPLLKSWIQLQIRSHT